MKMKFHNSVGDDVRSLTSSGSTKRFGDSLPRLLRSQQGVALIITVILLAVLTLTTLAFLAMSRRERGAVTTATDTASARLAADSALANAEAQILANALATTNPYNFGLIVSTNAWPLSFTNTSDLTNLYVSPRAPVSISNDFRFYLDLNRNGTNDPNGWLPETNSFGLPTGATNFMVGDPEWIGILQRPDQPYGPNNPFVARFAFIAVPIGNALDLNAIHNQVLNTNLFTASDGFFRNEGVGSWEINLAAFLADLNTNQWLSNPPPANLYYAYNRANPTPPGPSANTGHAFEDAFSLLSYRYGYNYGTLNSVAHLFANSLVFANDGIDGYSDGLLMTGFQLPVDNDNTSALWAGADNTNHFFGLPSDLFDPNKTSGGPLPAQVGFTNRLLNAGNGASTYDRYTFYRLLSQLGTDSTPESGKMNLNYRNVTNGVVVPNLETNFYSWTAIEFFTNAADRMLRDYSQEWLVSNPSNYVATFNVTNAFGIANIPVLIGIPGLRTNFVYTPAVQRVLQLAANIYDATTHNTNSLERDWPSVFRPNFYKDPVSGNVFISGYDDVSKYSGTLTVGTPPLDVPTDVAALPNRITAGLNNPNGNIYGVPWIIGAKKGFPNFNEFSMENNVWIERKLEVTRTNVSAPLSQYSTNQMYIMSVSNLLGVECWNSYSAGYTGAVQIAVQDTLSITLTNNRGSPFPYTFSPNQTTNLSIWPGTVQPWWTNGPNANSFVVPLLTNVIWFTNCMYVYNGNYFTPAEVGGVLDYLDVGTPPLPQFGLLTTNRLQVIMLDGNHVIDYVHFAGPDSARNLNAEIADTDPNYGLWNTNAPDGVPLGVFNQIAYSENPQQNGYLLTANDNRTWRNPPGGGTAGDAIASLNAFFAVNHIGRGTDPNTGNPSKATNLLNAVQVPFTPSRTVYEYISWQANDPLIHYVTSDLNFSGSEPNGGLETGVHQLNYSTTNMPGNNIGQLNDRYMPWGIGSFSVNLAIKDPQVYSSDDWDFPTNKLPTVGWLGRVHRGTPWQTVYLKSPSVDSATWTNWTGDSISSGFDATNSMPKQDRLLFDLFTTAFNDNAARGQLSVNVGATNGPSLAAWSALFSGVEALSNNAAAGVSRSLYFPRPQLLITNFPINPAGPAGAGSALGGLVASINQTRTNFVNADGLKGTFEHVGDILATPALTVQSPFLYWNNTVQQQNGISEEMYEWLPQQAMSLLRVSGSPRYVIYSYGQALKPAPGSIYTGSDHFGMVTNYQIVSEAATRAVVRFGSTLTNIVSADYSTVTNQVINNNAVIENFNVLPPD